MSEIEWNYHSVVEHGVAEEGVRRERGRLLAKFEVATSEARGQLVSLTFWKQEVLSRVRSLNRPTNALRVFECLHVNEYRVFLFKPLDQPYGAHRHVLNVHVVTP